MTLLVKLVGTMHLTMLLSSRPMSTTTASDDFKEDAKLRDASVNHNEIELLGKTRDVNPLDKRIAAGLRL